MNRNFGHPNREPVTETTTCIAVAVAAEVVVVIAIIMGAAITVNGHAIWAYVAGSLQ